MSAPAGRFAPHINESFAASAVRHRIQSHDEFRVATGHKIVERGRRRASDIERELLHLEGVAAERCKVLSGKIRTQLRHQARPTSQGSVSYPTHLLFTTRE